MIYFSKLVINNFLSWGKGETILLSKQGVVLVEGVNRDEPGADSNMAGKTTILEALVWCLYGRTIRNVKHDSVVNRFSKGGCFVSAYFRRNHVSYRASRYRKHPHHRNRLRLWRDGRRISYRHERDTQAKLESILGCDYQAFIHTTIFGGPRPFALLTDAEQKKVLESFLHFEKFDIALRRTKDLLSETIERRHELEIRVGQLSADIQGTRGRLGSLARADRVGKRKSERDRTAIEQRLKSVSRLYSKAVLRAASSKKELLVAGEKVEVLVTSLAKAGAKARLLHQRLESLRKTLRGHRKLIGKPCSLCGRKVVAETVKSFVDHVTLEGRKVEDKVRKVKVLIADRERRLHYARKVLKRVQKEHSNRLTQISGHNSLRRELESQLVKIKSALTATPFAEEISKLSFKYSRAVSQRLLLQFEMKELDQKIKDLKFWVSGFGNQGVKALIVREALPAMNQKLAEYAQEIYHGTVEIKFVPTKKSKSGTERELFHLAYKARFGSNSYLGESAGGRRRVDICVLLVFSWLSSSCNLLLVDELLDGLDSAGREAVLDILSRLRGTVLVISHERELKAKFQKIWTVIKKKGVSTLEKKAA